MTDYASPSVVAINILRYIGDHVLESGTPIPEISGIAEAVGASSNEVADGIIEELVENRLIRMGNTLKLIGGSAIFISVTLSLEGWEKYEEEKRGGFSGNHGFIALKFNDSDLDIFVNEVVKPAVREIGYELVDMRDVARAGVIDNIMRTQIRDSAFVIADLTHDNSGAYWEAGYAEGLGKPVIYICERTKFEEASTHFDTNHCTTVPWSSDDPDGFRRELIATLRRSLDLN